MRHVSGMADFAMAAALAISLSSCFEDRAVRVDTPTYEQDVGVILTSHCAECHGGEEPEAGWSVSSYLEAIGCVESTGEPAVLPGDDTAPLLRSLDSEDHRGRIDSRNRLRLEAWIRAGAPARKGSAHPTGIVDPRSEIFHGRALRDERWAPMLDAAHPDACGRCHAGTPTRPEGIVHTAPEATACTECHSDLDGVLACGTCHGGIGRPHPPNDPCFAEERPVRSDAHAAHLEAGDIRAEALSCEDCHPERDTEQLASGAHGDGIVDVELNTEVAGEDASFDSDAHTCSVSCHDREGERPNPDWRDEESMECDDCHANPPEEHNPDSCNRCHGELDEEGEELLSNLRHVNGEVEVGEANDECGTCHGTDDDPWPDTDRHPNHLSPEIGPTVLCETCHVVPDEVDDEGHLDDTSRAEVTFSGLAGEDAAYDTDALSCAVWCHTREGANPEPSWEEEGPLECGDCHGNPPEDHNTTGCDRCHLQIDPDGEELLTIELHLNGEIDLGDGSGECGACHGVGDEPWPDTGHHEAHREPLIAAPIECGTCHLVPEEIEDDGHLDTTENAEVFLTGLATARGAAPTFDGSACASVACHGFGLIDPVETVPRWDDPATDAGECGACHGLPPAWPHPVATNCESLMCHGGEVARWADGPRITEAGRALHMNGVIDVGRADP